MNECRPRMQQILPEISHNSMKLRMLKPLTLSVAKTAGFVFVVLPSILLAACAGPGNNWSYHNPPSTDLYYVAQEKILWCSSIAGARYTAITGWFAPDCYHTELPKNVFKVIDSSHEVYGTTQVVLIHCRGINRDIWLPLPSHHWA